MTAARSSVRLGEEIETRAHPPLRERGPAVSTPDPTNDTLGRATRPSAVLLVGPLPLPPLQGGIEVGIARLLASPLAHDIGMDLFNTSRQPDPTRSMRQRLRHQMGSCLRLAQTIASNRPAVVHVNAASGINFYQAGAYAAVARLLGRKVVLQLHAGDFPEFHHHAGRLGRFAIRTILGLPHQLIALSQGCASHLRVLAPNQFVAVIPNALSVAAYDAMAADRGAFGIESDRVALLFVGTRDARFDRLKGLPHLLEAVRRARQRTPELLLVLAGGAIDRAEVSRTLGPEGDGWIYLGTVSGDRKRCLYRSVDMFALPSHSEKMPNTVLEAMAAGLPTIATSVGAIPEMIEDGRSGSLVQPGDVEALARAIDTLTRDRDLRIAMGTRAHAIAAEAYDFPVLEEALRITYGAPDAALSTSHATVRSLRQTDCAVPAPVRWLRRPGAQRRLRLIGRLFSMSPREVAHRVGRIIDKQRAWTKRGDEHAPSASSVLVSDDAGMLARARGFFSPDQRRDVARAAHRECPDDVAHVVRRADAILKDGIDLLGRRFRPCDPAFDWLADPNLGRLWPTTKMDDADAVRRVRADVKFVWEVNRHQFLVTFGQAYAYTSDERYADAVVRLLHGWIAANPYGIGINWSSNLEVAVRLFSWIWCADFLRESPALSGEFARAWMRSIVEHRDHLAAHLSTYTDQTNHLLGELSALIAVSFWLPEIPGAHDHSTTALMRLSDELQRQVAEDGVDLEQSLSYQRFVLDFVLQVVALAERSDVPVPAPLRGRAHAMIDAVEALVGQHGRAPRIGDSDDARGMPFFTDDPWDFSELVQVGAAVLDRPTATPDGRLRESTRWLGNGRRLRNAGTASHRSSELLTSGYAILRSRSAPHGDRLVFDCGPLGLLPHASHGHADLLSVLVDVDGEEILTDASSFTYWDTHQRRNLFRSTRAHNTVEVGGRDQADAFDPFKWLNVPAMARVATELDPRLDYVEAWHDGYGRLRPAVRHRRAVLGLDGGWIVVDWLEGTGRQHVVRWFHAGPNVRVDPVDRQTATLRSPSRAAALTVRNLVTSADAPGIVAARAPYSERYGRMSLAPALLIPENVALPALRIVMLSAATSTRRGLQVLETAGSLADGAVWIRCEERDGTPVQIVVRQPGAPTTVGPMTTTSRVEVISGLNADHRRSFGGQS